MKIYKPVNAKGYLEIHHTCFLIEPSEECRKLSKIVLGKKTEGVESINIRLHLKERGKGKLPDFYYTNTHPIISSKLKILLESESQNNIEVIPARFIGAQIEPKSGDIEDIKLSDSGIVIDKDYYVLNIKEKSDVLDKDRTTMSKEFISSDVESEPGIYLKAIFRNSDVPLTFVLPGKPYGVLVSEKLKSLLRKYSIRGMSFTEIMDTKSENNLNMYPTDKDNTVSMAEAWKIYDKKHS